MVEKRAAVKNWFRLYFDKSLQTFVISNVYRFQLIDDSGKTRIDYNTHVSSKLSIPNAFSPNSDGINDTWVIIVIVCAVLANGVLYVYI